MFLMYNIILKATCLASSNIFLVANGLGLGLELGLGLGLGLKKEKKYFLGNVQVNCNQTNTTPTDLRSHSTFFSYIMAM